MENKRGSFSTVLVVILIIVMVVMGYMIYQMNFEMKQLTEKVKAKDTVANINDAAIDTNDADTDTNDVVADVKETVEKTSDSKYSEITKELEGIDVLFVTDAIENSDETYTLKGVIYTQYTISYEELSDILEKGSMTIGNKEYTIKNSDNANEYDLFEKNKEFALYKLKMINSNEYCLETQAQVSDNWKLTEEYRQITVPSDMLCTEAAGDTTVEEVFKNYKKVTPTETKIIPDGRNTFRFVFENGEIKNIYRAEYCI